MPPQLPGQASVVAPVAVAVDRSILLRTAALAAADSLSALHTQATAKTADSVPELTRFPLNTASPMQAAPQARTEPARMALPTFESSVPQAAAPPLSLPDARPMQAMPLTAMPSHAQALPAQAHAQAQVMNALRASADPGTRPFLAVNDRVTLSPARASTPTGTSALTSKPVGQLMLEMLDTLVGEPRSQWQSISPQLSAAGDAGTVARLAAESPGEALRLLVQGSVRSLDHKLTDLSFGMTVQRQPGSAAADPAIQLAVQQWAQTKILLDCPGKAADLAGHSANFQAVLDPRGLWPLQSFFLSGLLTFGAAHDDEEDEEDERLLAEDRDEQGLPQRRKNKAKLPPQDESTPLAADGGPPIISASRWLELELRYLRTQVRLWMGLPPAMEHSL